MVAEGHPHCDGNATGQTSMGRRLLRLDNIFAKKDLTFGECSFIRSCWLYKDATMRRLLDDRCFAEPQIERRVGCCFVGYVEIVVHPTTTHTLELLLDVTNHSETPFLCAADSALSSFVQLVPATGSYLGWTDSFIGCARPS
jgi:hypothetical protein